MATNRLFDRRVIPPRQRPLSEDHNLMFSLVQDQQRELLYRTYGGRFDTTVLNGLTADDPSFYGGFTFSAFKVLASAGMTVQITSGNGLSAANVTAQTNYGGNTGANINAAAPSPLQLSANQSITIAAAPAVGSSRIDIIEVRPNYSLVDVSPVSIWDLILRRFATQNVPKTLTWDLAGLTGQTVSPAASTAAISYKKGVEAVGAISAATEPSVTAGYIKVARVNVVGGTAAITQAMIADLRPLLHPGGLLRARVSVTIASATGGMGTEAFRAIHAPRGVWFRMVDTAASVGSSRLYTLYMFGVRAPAASTVNALLAGSAAIVPTSPLVVSTSVGTEAKVTSALRATLNGGACIGGAVDVAEGTPYIAFDVLAQDITRTTAALPAAAFPVTLDITAAQAL